MMEIVHPAAKYVARGKVVPAQSIAPRALGNGRNNSLAITLVCAPMILVLKYYGPMCVDAVSHTTKSTVQGHLDSKKHEAVVETMKKREKARVQHRLAWRPSLPILVIRDGHCGQMVLIGIVKIGRHGRTLWCLMPERRSATRRTCPFCMRFTIA